MSNITMKDIVNLSQARGFVYPWSEIYWGLANSWDYGPYWSLLKENIKNAEFFAKNYKEEILNIFPSENFKRSLY